MESKSKEDFVDSFPSNKRSAVLAGIEFAEEAAEQFKESARSPVSDDELDRILGKYIIMPNKNERDLVIKAMKVALSYKQPTPDEHKLRSAAIDFIEDLGTTKNGIKSHIHFSEDNLVNWLVDFHKAALKM